MAYFIDAEGNYPRHIGDVQIAAPAYVYGDDLPDGWVEVAEGVTPECGEGEAYVETAPKNIGGIITRQFKIVTAERWPDSPPLAPLPTLTPPDLAE